MGWSVNSRAVSKAENIDHGVMFLLNTCLGGNEGPISSMELTVHYDPLQKPRHNYNYSPILLCIALKPNIVVLLLPQKIFSAHSTYRKIHNSDLKLFLLLS